MGDRGSDTGSGPRSYNLGSSRRDSFELTHGDLSMMAGDLFSSSELRRLAKIRSNRPGKGVGTRDEVLYALYQSNKSDPRFGPGKWPTNFSKEVIKAVDDRYLHRAARNQSHFVAPGGATKQKGAGSTYRDGHEQALVEAFYAGLRGDSPDSALADEAMAQHFLQDAFASGHLRTPRQSIRDFWATRYPAFWDNFRKKIAHDVARYMNEHETNLATLGGTVQAIYSTVLAKMMELTQSMPVVGFDDLVARIAHDQDNEMGLAVVNEQGYTWTLYGDSNLDKVDPQNKTREMTEMAVGEGIGDVEYAHDRGIQLAPGTASRILPLRRVQAVRGIGKLYAPETYLPRLDKSRESSTLTWKADSFESLWNVPIRSDSGDTYGDRMELIVEPTGEIGKKLAALAGEFDKSQSAPGWSTLHPRKAYEEGFLKPLVDNPREVLGEIVHFNPSVGQAGFNTDDAAREDIEKMGKKKLSGLTLRQRADRIKSLVEGTFNYVGGDDGDLVLKLFEATPQSQRAELYRRVEGHGWKGDFIRGWFKSDDELWNALSRGRLRKLRKMINGS